MKGLEIIVTVYYMWEKINREVNQVACAQIELVLQENEPNLNT